MRTWRRCPRCEGGRVRVEYYNDLGCFGGLIVNAAGIIAFIVTLYASIFILSIFRFDVTSVGFASLIISVIIGLVFRSIVKGRIGGILFCKDCEYEF